jgi:MoaA/NifB/PqqE/SkfB family radical SAM enzyme
VVVHTQKIMPASLRVESTSNCQLRCPSCPTATGEVHQVLGKGFLHATDFIRLLDQGAGRIRVVELSNYGEPFLNPQLLDILRIAGERGVELIIKNGANLNNVREEVLEGLVKYGLRDITCSIDGASQETYAIYRKRGDFETVIGNIRKINEHKKKYHSIYPRLLWQFVVFGHNEHELEKARALAAELGMTFFPKLSWDEGFSPIRDVDLVRRQIGSSRVNRSEHLQKGEIYNGNVCEQLWEQPQINYDGRVLGCCVNYQAEFGGNAFEDLRGALNSERLNYARAMLTGESPPRNDIPCTTCGIYIARRKTGDWVALNAPKKVLIRVARRARSRVDALRFQWSSLRSRVDARLAAAGSARRDPISPD